MKNKYLCKTFWHGEWMVLGTVYANTMNEAWTIAQDKWQHVDSVYALDYCD